MTKIGEFELNKIYCMDCIEGMKKIPNESIDSIITDPPYNTGMKATNSKAWLSNFFDDSFTKEEYDNLVINSCKEYYRILKNNRGGGYIY